MNLQGFTKRYQAPKTSSAQLGVILPPHGTFDLWRQISEYRDVGEGLLTFSGWKPGMLLHILQSRGQPPPYKTKNDPA